jgi:hypothetical protein
MAIRTPASRSGGTRIDKPMKIQSSKTTGMKADTGRSRELTRQRYRPKHVHMLFVGEAPPASGLFFYDANSGLYRAIRNTFLQTLPVLRDRDFLKCFQRLGCYLVDLCGKPVDRLDKDLRRGICSHAEPRLIETIRTLKPKLIISVVRSIQNNVSRACEQAGFCGEHTNLPYPGRWVRHRAEFEKALAPILQREVGRIRSC